MVMEPSPSPQCVGREFVKQYYTMLNQAPNFLHRHVSFLRFFEYILELEWSTKKLEPDRCSNFMSPGMAESVRGAVVTNGNEMCCVFGSW